jgi:transcriptional regulator with XRE-family HTH domain
MQEVTDLTRRRELADFLRSRRARLMPAAAGLPSGPRRRTPGLRREEVAALAGIGAAWYTWLEQARDIRPSEGTLRRIARALQLNDTERKYVLELALEHTPRRRPDEVVTPDLMVLVDSIGAPAYLRGQRWDLVAYNERAAALFDFDYHPSGNLLYTTFCPQAQSFCPNWERTARRTLARFRFQNAGLLKDPWITEMVERLRHQSEAFRDWWAEQEVSDIDEPPCVMDHPFAGRLQFQLPTGLQVADRPNLRLEVFIGKNAETGRRIDELVRQRRGGQRSPAHNLYTALTARIQQPSASLAAH